jgi:hypothetical protein
VIDGEPYLDSDPAMTGQWPEDFVSSLFDSTTASMVELISALHTCLRSSI